MVYGLLLEIVIGDLIFENFYRRAGKGRAKLAETPDRIV